jgi:hypothetical protein
MDRRSRLLDHFARGDIALPLQPRSPIVVRQLWILVLTRFLRASRLPLRSKTLYRATAARLTRRRAADEATLRARTPASSADISG